MRRIIGFILVSVTVYFYSCSDFLDAKSDSSLALPNKVRDLQALLDFDDRMTMYFPAAGDIAADYYFLDSDVLATRSVEIRNTYVWDANAQNPEDWYYGYLKIFTANVVLDNIDNAELNNMTDTQRDDVKGQALFFRGWTYFQLSQLYTPPYTLGMPDSEYGLPLKFNADINEPTIRSSVHETYNQIIDDLAKSALLLPTHSGIATRPSKGAAYAALARLYLIMGDYNKSLSYTDSCLQIHHQLTHYGHLDSLANAPLAVLNDDVILHAVSLATSGVHAQTRAFVLPSLFEKFEDDDLRKKVFFRRDQSGFYRFKGSPSGSTAAIFAGLALDEVYLIRAECQARIGEEESAIGTLNTLLENFWEADVYEPLSQLRGDELLIRILDEREKQLMFRGGIRWTDLRRYNMEGDFRKNLTRQVGEEIYTLPAGDPRYTFLLPFNVVQMSGIKQNPR